MKLFGNKIGKQKNKFSKVAETKRIKKIHRIAYISTLSLGVVVAAVSLLMIIVELNHESAARGEYDALLQLLPEPTAFAAPSPIIPTDDTEDIDESPQDKEPIEEVDEGELLLLAMRELFEINNEFVGWIGVADLIEYPVVRGSHNQRYLARTFSGEYNPAGSIFMDYRNKEGFDEQICIIYGHITRAQSMFSPLHKFLDPVFLSENPIIQITTIDAEILTYEIFAARVTTVNDPAYLSSFTNTAKAIGAFPNLPSGAERFLLLSTCTANDDDDERLLVYAALAE